MKPTLPEDPEFHKKDYNVCYVDGTSFYGPWSFTFDYRKLISTYKEHIANHSDPDKRDAEIILRCGGTLVYKREICYVVIVTHSKDGTNDQEYPVITLNGLDTDIVQLGDAYDVPPTFHPKYVPVKKKKYDFNALNNYDHLAYAVNCDWNGEIQLDPLNAPHLLKATKPILKITLPSREPHHKYEDNTQFPVLDVYKTFHPICCQYGTTCDYTPMCYEGEKEAWNNERKENEIVPALENVHLGGESDGVRGGGERGDGGKDGVGGGEEKSEQ